MSITIERATSADAAAFLAGMEASCDDLMLLAKE